MRETIAGHFDFKNEKNMIEHLLIQNGHIPCFLPKFHPELNPIERVWAQLKRFTKAHCKYTLPSLRKNIPLAYDSVSLDNNYTEPFQKSSSLYVLLFRRPHARKRT